MFNPRYRDPWVHNILAGLCVGSSAGVFTTLNLLGAGGGRLESASLVQTMNATVSSVWIVSGCFGGSILNAMGPGPTMCVGVLTYVLYVGALWYVEAIGHTAFPLLAGAVPGVGAGMVFITSGFIQLAYPQENEKGRYIVMQNNLQAMGSVVCGLVPVIINRDDGVAAGAPASVYISFITIMLVAAGGALALQPPHKLQRNDGLMVAVNKPRGTLVELKANFTAFTDLGFLFMLPAYLPAGAFFIYSSSVNAFRNSLRTRSLMTFLAVMLQIPCGYGLQKILDHQSWTRKRRALTGLTVVGVPLICAWTIEVIHAKGYDRRQPERTLDWTDEGFGQALSLFVLTWVSSALWQYLVPYFIGSLTDSPAKLSHFMGGYRGVLAAGEATCFGLDAMEIRYVIFAGSILASYAVGVMVLLAFGLFWIGSTQQHQETAEAASAPTEAVASAKLNLVGQDKLESL